MLNIPESNRIRLEMVGKNWTDIDEARDIMGDNLIGVEGLGCLGVEFTTDISAYIKKVPFSRTMLEYCSDSPFVLVLYPGLSPCEIHHRERTGRLRVAEDPAITTALHDRESKALPGGKQLFCPGSNICMGATASFTRSGQVRWRMIATQALPWSKGCTAQEQFELIGTANNDGDDPIRQLGLIYEPLQACEIVSAIALLHLTRKRSAFVGDVLRSRDTVATNRGHVTVGNIKRKGMLIGQVRAPRKSRDLGLAYGLTASIL